MDVGTAHSEEPLGALEIPSKLTCPWRNQMRSPKCEVNRKSS
jgi:hypothetical protein